MAKIINGVKHYPVSQPMFDRLDNMNRRATDMIECDGESLTVQQYERWQALASECARLRYKAECTGYLSYLSGPDYGRMKAITIEQDWISQ